MRRTNAKTQNPATGELLEEFAFISQADLEVKIEGLAGAQRGWRESSAEVRSLALEKLAAKMLAERERLATSMTLEMGKPISQSRLEIDKSIDWIHFSAESVERLINDFPGAISQARYRRDPLGIILGVMPWNFPCWQVVRFAVAAIAMGNAAILKPSVNVMRTSLILKEIFSVLPFPVFDVVLAEKEQVAWLLKHPKISGLSFTGSDETGAKLASISGASLKKTVLELGGSDPYLVFADCRFEEAVNYCVQSRMINSGQSCLAAKRFLIEESIFSDFRDAFVELVKVYQPSNPLDDDCKLGPLAREDLRDKIHHQLKTSLQRGGRLLCGGEKVSGPGFFYSATVVEKPDLQSALFREEIFGPIAPLFSFRTEAEALELANDSVFGLGAAVFSSDSARCRRMADHLQTGTLYFNTFVRSDPRLPMGGIKRSGFGLELGTEGHFEFTQLKVSRYEPEPK